jgi:hypothetical protein
MAKTTLVGAKFPDEETERIDERWRALGLPDRSGYVRMLVARDLGGGTTPARSPEKLTAEGLREAVEATLAPAVYVLLSCGRRVATSEQALAVIEQVYLSGAAARELAEHLGRGGGAESDDAPEQGGEEMR